jgi:hypothetical protein
MIIGTCDQTAWGSLAGFGTLGIELFAGNSQLDSRKKEGSEHRRQAEISTFNWYRKAGRASAAPGNSSFCLGETNLRTSNSKMII